MHSSLPEGILFLLNKLTAKTEELNDLVTDKFEFSYKSQVLNISYNTRPAGVNVTRFA